MNKLTTSIAAAILAVTATASIAAPAYLITHNHTSDVSEAWIDGEVPPLNPAGPNKDTKTKWFAVTTACFMRTTSDGVCKALVRMRKDSGQSVDVGMLYVNTNTGAINPGTLSANGYTITVNGPGETTISKN